MQEDLDKVKLVVALRTARAIVGWSQVEFAQRIGISKSSVARLETQEAEITFSLLRKIINEYNNVGVVIDVMLPDKLNISVETKALEAFRQRLMSEDHRRSDRRLR